MKRQTTWTKLVMCSVAIGCLSILSGCWAHRGPPPHHAGRGQVQHGGHHDEGHGHGRGGGHGEHRGHD